MRVKLDAEITGAPERAASLVPALSFLLIMDFSFCAPVECECRMVSLQDHAQAGLQVLSLYLIMSPRNAQPVALGRSFVHRATVSAKVHRRPQLEANIFLAGK